MTCDETRELLSALLDEALDTGERAEVEAHLGGCADCRRELDGLRATTALLSRVERVRAPQGFVDRVMTQVRPVPWYRRLGRALFVPFSIKLPIEAGAVVVVAVLGVYLLQTTPELRDAARREVPPASSPPVTERSAPSAPIPAPAQDREAELKQEALTRKREAELEPKREYLQTPPPSSEDQTQQAAKDEAQKNVASPPPPPAQEAPKTEAPAPRSQMSRSTEARENAPEMADTDRKGARGAAPAAPSTLSAKQQMGTPVVSGALTVTDRERAVQSLTELIRRTSAREIRRREESGAVVVEVAVPHAEYAAFTRELATLGSLRLEGQPTEISPLVRLSVRISE
jgi:Putative zinc-finger